MTMGTLNPLTAVQRHLMQEVAFVDTTARAVVRWAIDVNRAAKKMTDTSDAVTRVNLTIENLGSANAVLKLQDSDGDIEDNNPPYPGTFEGTFSDIAGKDVTILPGTVQNIEVDITKPYLQVYGTGNGSVRIQGYATATVNTIGINDGYFQS